MKLTRQAILAWVCLGAFDSQGVALLTLGSRVGSRSAALVGSQLPEGRGPLRLGIGMVLGCRGAADYATSPGLPLATPGKRVHHSRQPRQWVAEGWRITDLG